jgi:hypothetical protein
VCRKVAGLPPYHAISEDRVTYHGRAMMTSKPRAAATHVDPSILQFRRYRVQGAVRF